MIRGIKIPWIGGVDIPWEEGQNTVGRGLDIPWVGGSIYHG
jgi:hypothetical protein